LRLFVYGFGFTGEALARRLLPKGWSLAGTARSLTSREAAAAAGVEPIDAADAEAVRATAASADAVLVAAPPGSDGCPAAQVLADVPLKGWLGYLSTTGVYGDRAGRWVFEDSPLHPQSQEAVRRAAAEAVWSGRGASIFRLPGIYGPRRSAFDRLRDGTARRLVKPGHLFSRIHVDDLAAGVEASLRRPSPRRVYNLCDDEPAPAAEVTAYAAGLMGIEPPPEELLDPNALSPAARRFWGESKRVSNALAKAELGWRPLYPTYREGLAAVWAAEGGLSGRAG
jgi:nucleoside-diphosphate-sugar epimerase